MEYGEQFCPSPSNRLAKEALEEVQWDQIIRIFNLPENQRLFQSFCHGLGFLYDQNEAKDYAHDLLSPQGIIGERLFCNEIWQKDCLELNRWAIKCFVYIAPANPEAALGCIESLSCGNYRAPRKISAFQCFCGHKKTANRAAWQEVLISTIDDIT